MTARPERSGEDEAGCDKLELCGFRSFPGMAGLMQG